MTTQNLLRVGFFLLGGLVVLADTAWAKRKPRSGSVVAGVLALLAGGHLVFMAFLWVNHLTFPLNLDLMEAVVLQHFERAMAMQPIYSAPSPTYVALAYNPLYYVLAVPFGYLLGIDLATLRLVAIFGMVGALVIVYWVVRRETGSIWWGVVAGGLFAAAYRVMDTYLDSAHSDSWLLFTALLGSLLIGHDSSRRRRFAGVAILTASFWFKQHGALFLLGGVTFLTWREGPRRSWPYWLLAGVLGPLAYISLGPWLFGPFFHYFTWEVPSAWSEINLATCSRYARFIATRYGALALASVAFCARTASHDRSRLSIWEWQFVFALLSGFMGALDAGSADNVFIPMGTWFILLGTMGLNALAEDVTPRLRLASVHLLLVASFALMLYNPLRVVVSTRAEEGYRDLVQMLRSLEGHVYAPSIGQLPSGYALYPAAHWVALDDMTRGPGRDNRNHPLIRQLLDPALHPEGKAYILANYPLEVYPWLAFLNEYYVLESDLGDRFEPLRVLPKRWDHGWPRYLYRYDPRAAVAQRSAASTRD